MGSRALEKSAFGAAPNKVRAASGISRAKSTTGEALMSTRATDGFAFRGAPDSVSSGSPPSNSP